MANPQLENGYARVANEILGALAKVSLSPYESRLIWIIVSQTYGNHGKKMDRISLSQFSDWTGIDRRNVRRSLASLLAKGVIAASPNGMGIKYGLQKNYEQWKPKGVSAETVSTETVSAETLVSVATLEVVSAETPTKEKDKKERRVKDKPSPSFTGFTKGKGTSESTLEGNFNHFWSSYPIKTGKGAALRAWKKLKPDCEIQAKIQTAIKAQIQWREERDPKLFTPEWKHPTTWLNAMAWEDQVEAFGEAPKAKTLFYCKRCGTSHPEGEHTK